MAKENRIFILKVRDSADGLWFHMYNSTTGTDKGAAVSVGKVNNTPAENEPEWETLKNKCAEELKGHLIEIANGRVFKDIEYKVVYSNIFETSGMFSHQESFHIRSSIYFTGLRHINPMEPNDIRLFQAAFNSIK